MLGLFCNHALSVFHSFQNPVHLNRQLNFSPVDLNPLLLRGGGEGGNQANKNQLEGPLALDRPEALMVLPKGKKY
jgi:hypothetical protein